MKFPLPRAFLWFITLAAGFIVLTGYFFDLSWLTGVRSLFLEWAIVFGAVILVGGVAGLASLHWRNARNNPRKRAYSLILLASMLVTLLILVFDDASHARAAGLLKGIFIPIETSLVALLAFILLASAVRLAFSRMGGMTIVFLGAAGLTLMGASPVVTAHLPEPFSAFVYGLPLAAAGAGIRGLLIGVGLGAVVVGLRFWLGVDRPHHG